MTNINFTILNSHVAVIHLRIIKSMYFCVVKQKNVKQQHFYTIYPRIKDLAFFRQENS